MKDARGSGGNSSSSRHKASFRPYHSLNVPKQADLVMASQGQVQEQQMTTLMLRHIPNKYTQDQLLQELDLQGFTGEYDFFYMPMDIHNRTNVGYAFINLVTTSTATAFFNRFSNYKFQLHPSSKIGAVSPAHVQGMAKNVLHFSNRAVTQSRNNEYRPIVVRNGEHLDISVVLAELQGEPPPAADAVVQADDAATGPMADEVGVPVHAQVLRESGACSVGVPSAEEPSTEDSSRSRSSSSSCPSATSRLAAACPPPPGLDDAAGEEDSHAGNEYVVVKDELVVFASCESWTPTGSLRRGDVISVAGPPRRVDEYTMIPVHPEGAVQAMYLQARGWSR